MLYKRESENGEVMIESMLVLIPTLFVIIFLLSLGFLMYQQWNVQYIADTVANNLSVIYSYDEGNIFTGEITDEVRNQRRLYRYLFGYKNEIENAAKTKGKTYGLYLLKLTNFAKASDENITIEIEDDVIGRKHLVVKVSGDYEIPFGAGLEIFNLSSSRHMEASCAAECVDITEYFASVNIAENAEGMLLGNSKVLSAIDSVLSLVQKIKNFGKD